MIVASMQGQSYLAFRFSRIKRCLYHAGRHFGMEDAAYDIARNEGVGFRIHVGVGVFLL